MLTASTRPYCSEASPGDDGNKAKQKQRKKKAKCEKREGPPRYPPQTRAAPRQHPQDPPWTAKQLLLGSKWPTNKLHFMGKNLVSRKIFAGLRWGDTQTGRNAERAAGMNCLSRPVPDGAISTTDDEGGVEAS